MAHHVAFSDFLETIRPFGRLNLFVDYEGQPGMPWSSGEKDRLMSVIEQEINWRRERGESNLALWIWADGEVKHRHTAPLVDLVSQTQWDPNGR
jgi:hypothetical protein